MNMYLFGISVALSVVGALGSIVLKRNENASKLLGSLFGMGAAALALVVGFMGIFSQFAPITIATPFSFASLTILINPLSGLLLVVINLLALVAWFYGIGYLKEYTGKGVGVICLFMHLFVVSMNMVVVVDNVFWFLVFFEVMSISSYFLVIVNQDEKSVKAGFLYLVMAHIGFFLIMIAFFILSSITGSFDFAGFRETDFGPVIASLVFVLSFLGFGIKAGMIPFHSWLPQAHPAAPSHISALMSGALIKIGVFGIIKVAFDLLAASGCELWWGLIVIVLGAISSVLGITYALAERDIKRLLAYSSVENIGIMLMGVGVALIGIALELPLIAGLGLLAGLFHMLNHSLFKGLLFFGAGSVLYGAHSRDLGKLGGLVRVMPVTAMCFLIGALAISAIPPLNGFVSEWFTYQSMISLALAGNEIVMIVVAFAVVSLALTAGLAVCCFVKAYGITFLGTARSDAAHKATESPLSMKIGMIALAACCVVLGVGAPWAVPVVEGISSSILMTSGVEVSSGIALVNPDFGAAVSTPLVAVLIIALVAVPIILRAVWGKGGRQAPDSTKEPWACGYLHDADMPMIASSFGAPVQMFLEPLYTMRSFLSAQSSKFVALFRGTVRGAEKAETFGDRYVVDSVASFVVWLSRKVQGLEGGNFRVYIVYIVVALIALLVIAILV